MSLISNAYSEVSFCFIKQISKIKTELFFIEMPIHSTSSFTTSQYYVYGMNPFGNLFSKSLLYSLFVKNDIMYKMHEFYEFRTIEGISKFEMN